jgi:hypothetical protein
VVVVVLLMSGTIFSIASTSVVATLPLRSCRIEEGTTSSSSSSSSISSRAF